MKPDNPRPPITAFQPPPILAMVLTLYASPISTCSKRVALVLHEKEVPFTLVSIDLRSGGSKTPEHLARQPFGKVPVLDDDGYLIYESRAIARYIVEKYASQGTQGLIPTDLKAKGLFEQAASIEQSNFDGYVSTIVAEAVFKPFHGLEPDKDVIATNTKILEDRLDVYEKILSKQKYLAGDEVTLADLFHLPYGVLLAVAGNNAIQERPHVAKWFQSLVDRPAWQAVTGGVTSRA